MAKKANHTQFYRDVQNDWRWRAMAANGRIVSDSGEGYRTKRAAVAGATRAREALSGEWRGLA